MIGMDILDVDSTQKQELLSYFSHPQTTHTHATQDNTPPTTDTGQRTTDHQQPPRCIVGIATAAITHIEQTSH